MVTWDNVEDNGTQVAPSTWNFVKVYDSEEAANALDKSLLVEKLNEANALMSESGFNVTIGEAVALSVGEGGNLTTNYPAIDSDVLANCIDTDPNTLFHSNWRAGTTSGHYLQVDLGEGNELEAFQLNYLTRQSGNNAAPYSAIVYGSNNGEDFVPLAELSKDDKINPLPDTNGPSYSTMVFADKAYRYIRFTVLTSPTSNGSFGLATFEIKKATLVRPTGNYVNRFRSQGALYNTVVFAQKVNADDNTTQTQVNEAYNGLVEAVSSATKYPFTITADVNTPYCYAIKSARSTVWSTDHYWTFIPGNGGALTIFPGIDRDSENYKKDIYKYWFFQENVKGHLQMVPVAERNAPMGYLTVENGQDKMRNDATVANFAGDTYSLIYDASYDTYPYALQPYGTDNYVSNNGGNYGSPKMGFWKNDGFGDTGGRIDFIELPTPSAKLEDLAAVIASASIISSGTEVGYYTVESVNALKNETIAAAMAVLANALSTDEECQAQIDAINNAVNSLSIVLPENGLFYNIVSACSKDHRAGQMIYVNDEGAMHFSRNDAEGLELAKGSLGQVVQFVSAGDGSFYVYFVARDRYLSTSLPNHGGQHSAKVEDVANAKKVTITNMGSENIVKIVSEGGGMLHAQDHQSQVVAWDENAINDGSAWRIVEVSDPTTASFDLTIGAAGYSTLYLGCDVTIPEGVEAYVVSEIKDTYVNMTAVTGTIPANEAVILKKAEGQPAEATSYSFNYATSANAVEANLLNGTTINTYVAGPAYVLSKPADSEVGLYKAALNVDATGAATGEQTHFLNNANKAYLAVPAEQAQNAASLSFRFDGTTGIENVEGQSEGAIYDLMGRRVENPTRGIYVINGKKVLVK